MLRGDPRFNTASTKPLLLGGSGAMHCKLRKYLTMNAVTNSNVEYLVLHCSVPPCGPLTSLQFVCCIGGRTECCDDFARAPETPAKIMGLGSDGGRRRLVSCGTSVRGKLASSPNTYVSATNGWGVACRPSPMVSLTSLLISSGAACPRRT